MRNKKHVTAAHNMPGTSVRLEQWRVMDGRVGHWGQTPRVVYGRTRVLFDRQLAAPAGPFGSVCV